MMVQARVLRTQDGGSIPSLGAAEVVQWQGLSLPSS